MILGISGSPRVNGITAHAVKEVLAHCESETKYISLAGKKISGCVSCLGCTKDNRCVVRDDFPEIAQAMVAAEAIILGIPNYYRVPNGLSHCLLERCFCFRHQGSFLLEGKPSVLFSTGYSSDDNNSQVLNVADYFMIKNKVSVVSKFQVGAFSQCYSCKYALNCEDGNIVKDNGFVDKVTAAMLPPEFAQQPDSIEKCHNAADLLNDILKKK